MLDFLVSHSSEMAVAVGFFREGTKRSQGSHGVTSDLVREREREQSECACSYIAPNLCLHCCVLLCASEHGFLMCYSTRSPSFSQLHIPYLPPYFAARLLPGVMG